jgi:hypothetical protein
MTDEELLEKLGAVIDKKMAEFECAMDTKLEALESKLRA